MKNEKTKEIKYIDLFGGVGGFRLGIERANNRYNYSRINKTKRKLSSKRESFKSKRNNESSIDKSKPTTNVKCIFYSEIDKYAVETYNKNFNENWKANDIRTIEANSIPDFDMLCGGFPCQAFSIAGKRRGFEDTRGTLFFEIARIIKAKRPKIIFLENVKGLLNHNKGETFRVIIQTISELGYDVQWMVLNSKFFGVPQNRERVFIIGSLREEYRPEILPFRESYENISQGINPGIPTSQSLRAGYYKGGQGTHINVPQAQRIRTTEGVVQTFQGIEMIGSTQRNSAKMENISPALTEAMGKEGGHVPMKKEDMKIRRLTPIECERLQGFPDNWTEGVSDTQRYKQMGNAVTVNVIQAIMGRMLK